jgi:hypothetical protein
VRLPLLSEVRQVTTDWTPYVGTELVVHGGRSPGATTSRPATEQLRKQLGQRVVRNGPIGVESSDVHRHLGLV